MQVFHTAGEPPRRGRIIFPIRGSTIKRRPALRNSVRENSVGSNGKDTRVGKGEKSSLFF